MKKGNKNGKDEEKEEQQNCGCGDDCKCTPKDHCGCGGHLNEEHEEDDLMRITADEYIELQTKLVRLEEQKNQTATLARNYKSDMERMRDRNKIFEQEKTTEIIENLTKKILPIIDNFEAAFAHTEANKTTEGFKMILNQMMSLLDDMNVTKIDTSEEFDPAFHECIATVPAKNKSQANKIADVLRTGYTFGSRIIRPAVVRIYH